MWYLTFVLDEQRQVIHESGDFMSKTRNWWSDGYNKFDAAAYILLAIGFAFRAYHFYNLPEQTSIEPSCSLNFEGTTLGRAHYFYCVAFAVFMIRTISYLSPSVHIIMIHQMALNMINFLVYFGIFGLAYGIATQALLYPNEWRTREVIYEVLYVPYYTIYGELFNSERSSYGHAGDALSPGDDCYDTVGQTIESAVNDLERIEQRCPNISPPVELLSGGYMLIANVLLLNLLIALFSSTYNKIEAMAIQHYKFGKYKLVHEYFYKPVLPPPFVIISWTEYIVQYFIAVYKNGFNNVSMSQQFVERIDKFRGTKHALRRVYLSAMEIHEKVINGELNNYGDSEDDLRLFELWAMETYLREKDNLDQLSSDVIEIRTKIEDLTTMVQTLSDEQEKFRKGIKDNQKTTIRQIHKSR